MTSGVTGDMRWRSLDEPQLEDAIRRLRRLVASLRFTETDSALRTRTSYEDALAAATEEQRRRSAI